MGSFTSNFLLITFLAIVTFVVLDINQSDIYEKSTTAKYLNKVGATPYINKSIATIKTSKFYKLYFLPNWNALIRFLRPHFSTVQTNVLKYKNHATKWIQKNTVSLVDYVDTTVIPVAKGYYSHYGSVLQTYFNRVYSAASEQTLIASNWLSKNVWTKLPQEEMQKAFVRFVTITQKTATDTFQWVSTQVQKLIV
ncbi:hypothetical protein TYRP_004516 [Tyrophagus putrescentiae]|nr:hypothetical protein TYRP_004516 [Tyrophagus putrescentiae]